MCVLADAETKSLWLMRRVLAAGTILWLYDQVALGPAKMNTAQKKDYALRDRRFLADVYLWESIKWTIIHRLNGIIDSSPKRLLLLLKHL